MSPVLCVCVCARVHHATSVHLSPPNFCSRAHSGSDFDPTSLSSRLEQETVSSTLETQSAIWRETERHDQNRTGHRRGSKLEQDASMKSDWTAWGGFHLHWSVTVICSCSLRHVRTGSSLWDWKKSYFWAQPPWAEQMSPWQPKPVMKLKLYRSNSNSAKPRQASRCHHTSFPTRCSLSTLRCFWQL